MKLLHILLVTLVLSISANSFLMSASSQAAPSPEKPASNAGAASQSAGASKAFLTDEQNQFVSIVGLVLTIVAFGIAIWQTRLAISQNRDASSQANRLGQIADALSTKYIGPYPQYIAQIPEVLSRATRQIRVLCSVPMHGVFNSPDAWLKSKQAIEAFLADSTSDRELRCVFATKEEREKLQRNQYKSLEANWEKWNHDPDNQKKLLSLLNRVAPRDAAASKTFEGFLQLLERASVRELSTTFERALISEIEYPPPMFLWIADDKEAIFVLKTTYPEFRAEAFWTSDARLIQSLTKIHESYMLSSKVGTAPLPNGGD